MKVRIEEYERILKLNEYHVPITIYQYIWGRKKAIMTRSSKRLRL